MKSTTKDEVLVEIVDLLTESYGLQDRDIILEKIRARENKMSTGIGYGVAVPHAKHDGLQELRLAVGISRVGIPFEAIDDEPVFLFYIMVSPANTAGPHIQTLSAISRIMSYEDMRTRLRAAKDADEFLKLLAEGEAKYL